MCMVLECASQDEAEVSYDDFGAEAEPSGSFFALSKERFSAPRPVGELSRREVGLLGEDFAARFLEDQGFELLERNWRCRRGEADIIAESPEGALTFVEVKTRRCSSFEGECFPEEAVDAAKQQRYACLAEVYLCEHKKSMPVEVDVASILIRDDGCSKLRLIAGNVFVDA